MVCRVECPLIIHAVWGFQDSNGDTITEFCVSELGLSVSFEVFFTVIKGTPPGTRRADITGIPKTASKYNICWICVSKYTHLGSVCEKSEDHSH